MTSSLKKDAPFSFGKMLDLIWSHTHADYKTTINGRRWVMYMSKDGTTLGPLDDLPKDVFDKLFLSAARQSSKEKEKRRG